jgi:alpha-ketoglutarate-dependent taurine dioxygenase
VTTQKPATAGARSKWAARRGERPVAISTAQQDWVETSLPVPGRTLPLLIQPRLKEVGLHAWATANRDLIHRHLYAHGALVFRGFGLHREEDFDAFLSALAVDLLHYAEGATPRTQVAERIYTSTEFPADQTIAPHNELSYVLSWPMKIWFFCVTAPGKGGETPLVDVRKVYQRLPREVVAPFEEKGWMLVRNFHPGLGKSWQHAYRVETPEELEGYCRTAEIDFEWLQDGHLRTRQVRPAVACHRVTGERVWFNHVAFWHASSLAPDLREVFLQNYGEEGLPYNTFYGDGTAIDDAVISLLRAAYDQELVALPWEQGDLMMVDNLLVAHGRRPFEGPRRILVAMADPCSDRNL